MSMTDYVREVLEVMCASHVPLKLAQVASDAGVPMALALVAIQALRSARLVLRVTGDGLEDVARYVPTPIACKLARGDHAGDELSKQILDEI